MFRYEFEITKVVSIAYQGLFCSFLFLLFFIIIFFPFFNAYFLKTTETDQRFSSIALTTILRDEFIFYK